MSGSAPYDDYASRKLAAARRGDHYELGEAYARELLEDDARRRQAAQAAGAQREVYARLQAEADRLASQHDPAVVARAAEAFRAEADADALSFEESLARWQGHLVREAAGHEREREAQQARDESRVLTDAKINAMSADEWRQVYDVERGAFRPGYEYRQEAGDGPTDLHAISMAAAGLAPIRLRPSG